MEYYKAFNSISIHPHHVKQTVCGSRAKYRDGKKDTAVKVYTINQESVYLLITNVSAVGASEELRAQCDQYGIVDEFRPVDDYPCEDFTEAYLVKYNSFPSARSAKRYLDDKSFMGNTLHVFYAPEFESVYETRMKLQDRRKYIAWKTKTGKSPSITINSAVPNSSCNKSVKTDSAARISSTQPVTYVWAGKEYTVYPESSTAQDPVVEAEVNERHGSSVFLPRQLKQKPSEDSNFSTNSQVQRASNTNLSLVDDSSYSNTISSVRSKVSKVSVPNVRVSLKRRKRI